MQLEKVRELMKQDAVIQNPILKIMLEPLNMTDRIGYLERLAREFVTSSEPGRVMTFIRLTWIAMLQSYPTTYIEDKKAEGCEFTVNFQNEQSPDHLKLIFNYHTFVWDIYWLTLAQQSKQRGHPVLEALAGYVTSELMLCILLTPPCYNATTGFLDVTQKWINSSTDDRDLAELFRQALLSLPSHINVSERLKPFLQSIKDYLLPQQAHSNAEKEKRKGIEKMIQHMAIAIVKRQSPQQIFNQFLTQK